MADPHKNTNDCIRLGALELLRPAVMGILNVTPDSFSDDGLFSDLDAARQQAESMARDGAAIIDVGGESTRPGAADVDESQELERVIPVIEAIRQVTDLPISIDTSKPAVMRHAVMAGATMINDVAALRSDGAVEAVAKLQVPVCLMHMQGRPRSMQDKPAYDNVTVEVHEFLQQRIEACIAAGIEGSNIVVDPGFGFGKTHAHNVELLANLRQLADLGAPCWLGCPANQRWARLPGVRSMSDWQRVLRPPSLHIETVLG